MADPESIHGSSVTDGTLAFPAVPRLPPAAGSPPPRPAIRSASESDWDISQRNLAGVRKVSEPAPLRASPLKEAATINGETGSPQFDFSTPTPTTLEFDSSNPFAAAPFQKPESPVELYDCPSPLSRTVYRSNLVEYDSQDEDTPHTMSSATSSDTELSRRSLDIPPQQARATQTTRAVTSTVQVKPRPKSILSRLLRQTNDDDFEPVPGPNPRGIQQPISAPGPVAKTTKRKSTNPEKWTKRASRKAPPPPISLSPPMDQPLAALGLQLSRQTGNGSDSPRRNIGNFWRRGEDDRATLDEDDELSWERVRTLPRVCLFPPEEESAEPITLYPPPAPPQLRRPPTLLLARERVPNSGSRSSLYSNTSMGTGHDVWGGMSGGFTKPPPVFKRQPRRGSTIPEGIVMPKKRDQVEREQEWRMSLINQEMDDFDLAWRAEQSPPVGPQSPPALARQQSLPQEASQRKMSLEEAAPIVPTPQAPLSRPFANTSANPSPARAASPPPVGIYDRPASFVSPERSVSAPPTIDFGASPPPLVLVRPSSGLSMSTEATSAQDAPGGTHQPDVVPRSAPVIHERPLSSLERVRQATAAPPASRRSSEDSRDSSSTASTSRPNKGLRNRRSMSLTSMLSSKHKEEAPPVPIAQTTPKTIKKQRSLKNFFFSSDNLSREESGSMPPLPKRDKEQDQALAREKELQRDRVKVIANEMKEKEKQLQKDKQREKEREKEERHRIKEADKAEGSRRSSRPLLSRPKSKPNLKIDIKATKATTLPSPSIPPMPHSAPMSSASSASSPYPQTPASGSQPSLGGRSTSTSTKGSPPAPPSASRGITKRFSLTNMSGAFRRSRKNLAEVQPVPQVPDLPDVYKKEKASKPKPWQSLSKHSAPPTSTGHAQALQAAYAAPHVVRTSSVPMPSSSKMTKSTSLPHVEFEGAPGSFLSNEDEKAYLSPQSKGRDIAAESSGPAPAHKAIHQPRSSLSSLKHLSHAQISPTASVFSDSSSTFELEQELDEAQVVLISPKARRDPAVSLQTVMGITPGARMSGFIESPAERRKSVEAIVVGPLLIPPTPPHGAVYLPSLAESPASIQQNRTGTTKLEFDGPEFDELENTPTQSPRQASSQAERGDSMDQPMSGPGPRLGPSQSESESSLESLGRSSVSSEPSDLPCVTPASPNSETLHYPPMAMTSMIPDVPTIDLGISPYQITDLPEVTDSPASQMDVDSGSEEYVDAKQTQSHTALDSLPSEESDLVVVHHSPSFALATSPIGSPTAGSTSTVSPRHSSKWSPEGGLFRFLSGGSEKGSPRSISTHKRRSGTSPSTSPRFECDVENTPQPNGETPNSLGLDLDSTASQLSFPVPPSKPDGYTGLGDKVQLKSLHFDTLSLDFDGFDWSKSALGGRGLGLESMDEQGVESVL